MGKIILVTGGGRSGKSLYAQNLAEQMAFQRVFIATCPVLDDEMRERVRRHREQRAHAQWRTIEEQVDLAGNLACSGSDATVLIDCLTLWINNLMFEKEGDAEGVSEDDIRGRCERILESARKRTGTTILVTNEVGFGIIPGDAVTRRFRDLSGRCNQVMAQGADKVILMISGIPVTVK